jgi:peroxiredoxin
MRRCLVISFILLTAHSFAQQQALMSEGINIDSLYKAMQAEAVSEPFPLFTTRYKGGNFTNENLKGKTVFINFWFAACTPCMAELNELNNLYDTLKSDKKFEFISFTFESPEVIKRIKKKYNIHYKILALESDDCLRLNRNAGFPTSIIIDSNGTIKFFKIGGSLDKEEINKTIFTEYYPVILKEL